jgi:2-desacetyl-2-hydroxyethyl bacteriochlorophyllide A dehydrogenase
VSVRKVVLERPGVVRLADGEEQRAGKAEALVRLRTAGICGSDLSAYRGTSPLVSYPRVLGHEVLVDVLQSSDKPELEGRRAVLDPMIPCEYCRACRAGRTNCCVRLKVMGVHVDGGLQETYVVNLRNLHPLPAEMPDEVAVLAEPLTIAYHAVQRSAISAGQIAVVFGAGAIGLLIARLLVAARGCRAFVVDVDADRLRIAEGLGAVSLGGNEAELVQVLGEATDGDMADVVFEASGNAAATRATTALADHAGSIVLVGWNKGPVEYDTVTLMRKELTVLGSRNSFNAFPAALRLLADGLVDPHTLITHRFAFVDTAEALDVLDKNQGIVLKVLITM